ncbi:esterase [Erwinia persicina]|uniref:esterase n=1 Tax=Erwinia persicina TaxID=55211 RepID=UPI00177A80DE|nr:esterase [Erwinia persicina]MBD8164095.1 esterase [Erwinia persicina]MBD8215732.1 esterase [Erwinia persicina]
MKFPHVVVQTPSLPATQLFLLYHAAGDNPVAMGEIGHWFAGAFPRALVVSIGGPQADADGGFHWYMPSVPDGHQQQVDGAMDGFIASVRHWQQQSGVNARATALIGFAQGATMALEAIKVQPGLAGRVVAFSGRYATLPDQAGTRTTIHLIHGDNDTVLPLTHAVAAEERLSALGGDVTLDIIDDLPHAIDERAMRLALERLQFTVPRRYFDEALSGAKPGDDDVIALM